MLLREDLLVFFIICPRPHDYSFKVILNLVLFSSINTVRSLLDIHLTLDLAGLYFIVKDSDENIVNAKCSLREKIGNAFIISLCLDYFCPFLVSWVLIHFSTICSVIQILASRLSYNSVEVSVLLPEHFFKSLVSFACFVVSQFLECSIYFIGVGGVYTFRFGFRKAFVSIGSRSSSSSQ